MQFNRRNFLKILGAGGATLAQVSRLQQVLANSTPGTFLPTSVIERDLTTHAIARLTFGPTAELVEHVHSIGPAAFIEEQLSPEGLDDSHLEPYLTFFPDLEKTARDLFQQAGDNPANVGVQLTGNWVVRALYSQRQLYERMVHFWSDHFSIFVNSAPLVILKLVDDREVIRRHAMGRFRDLLGASAHSPAMLIYLNNAESEKSAPNENYARELMELHTLGIDGGYTETDVKEVARCFTGWTVAGRGRLRSASLGEYVFDPRIHDDGEKIVLRQIISAGGSETDGEIVLDMLASHPSTARFISTKLVRRFVADNPPPSLVDACTQTFLQTQGDITSVLRTLFASAEFWNAAPKFKRPFEYTMSVLRALNYDVQAFRAFGIAFRDVMLNMGHLPFNRPTPDGYPDVQEEWTANMLTRWNIAIAAAHGGIPGASGSLLPLLEAHSIPLEGTAIINFLGQFLYGRPLTSGESQVLMDYLATGNSAEILQDTLALLLAAPAFQYR